MASSSILGILESAAAAFGIPASLFTAQATQESSLNPNAYNAKSGATGLLQLEPATAAQYGVAGADLTDPVANATAGANYLSDLYDQFGSWDLALAAYDAGPGTVQKAIASATNAGDASDWLSYTPSETQNYVATILSNSGLSPTAAAAPPLPTEAAAPSPDIDAGDETSDSGGDSWADLLPAASTGSGATPLFLLLLVGAGVYFGASSLAEIVDW